MSPEHAGARVAAATATPGEQNTPTHEGKKSSVSKISVSADQPLTTSALAAHDREQIDKLARAEIDFRDHMRDAHPDLVPGTPQWQLAERNYQSDERRYIDLSEVLTRPAWASMTELEGVGRPVYAQFESDPARVNLSWHNAQKISGATFKSAYLAAKITQYTISAEPRVEIERFAFLKAEGEIAPIAGSAYFLSLHEAAEIAHLLLLLVDVADTAGGESA